MREAYLRWMEAHGGAIVNIIADIWHGVPMQRYGTESEVSAAIVYLLSPAAAYITGSCVRVDGGTPNARNTWKLEPHARSQPFEAFHRATLPKLLSPSTQGEPTT